MLLTLDLGNTNILMGGFDGGKLCFSTRFFSAHWRTAEEWAVLLRDMLGLYGVDTAVIEGAAISSVVPPVTKALARGVELAVGHDPLIIGPGVKTGLNILIDNPAQLGSDMVCNSVAALVKYKPPIIIFDMGTATSLSVLDKDGNFIGGAIIPGVKTSLDALSSQTAQLPRIPLEAPKRVIGANTIDCMQSGVVFSAASVIDGMSARVERELGDRATVLLTGGIGEVVFPHVNREVIHDPALLLEGLRIIYGKNKAKR